MSKAGPSVNPSVKAGSSASKQLAMAFGLAFVVLVTAWITRVSEGRRSIASCDAALARGDRIEAIVQARAAAQARCPLCDSPEIGYTRLATIAKDAEGRADDATAVAAWRAARAAALGTIATGGSPERRDRADAEIARLEHRIDAAAVAAAGGSTSSPAASEEKLREALMRDTMPSSMVFVMLSIGGVLFLVGAARFVHRSPSSPSKNLTPLGISVAGIGLAVVSAVLF